MSDHLLLQRGAAEIWELYQRGVQHHHRISLYNKSDQAHRFFLGDQWYGLKGDGEQLPVINIIQPTVEYKVASIVQNYMTINYSPMNSDEKRRPIYTKTCEMLNKFAAAQWERLKMDSLCWKIVKDSCITGDSYVFFYDRDLGAVVLDNTSVHLSDERQSDLQKQKYIIIYERRFVSDVKREARKNKVPHDEIERIVADDEGLKTENYGGCYNETGAGDDAKCSCLLMMQKDGDGIVHITRSTKNVVYQPDTTLKSTGPRGGILGAMRLYPIAALVWMNKKGSARGRGEVEPLIANQIEINRTFARRVIAVKMFAFPKLAFNSRLISNPDALNIVGANIEVKDNGQVQSVENAIKYLNPAPVSPDAKLLSDEMIALSRDLAGAGDAVTGSINPEKASGAAIIAARDQAALPLNEQVAKFKQLVEDIAKIWYETWVAYNPMGLRVDFVENGRMVSEKIPQNVLEGMKINIRIDVSPNNPFSKFAQEQALDRLFVSNALSFEEYVSALDDNSSVPKAKLLEIISRREAKSQELEINKLYAMLYQATPDGGGVQPAAKENGPDKNALADLWPLDKAGV